jgi:hypothetical protein
MSKEVTLKEVLACKRDWDKAYDRIEAINKKWYELHRRLESIEKHIKNEERK